jgi:hypothetical protein
MQNGKLLPQCQVFSGKGDVTFAEGLHELKEGNQEIHGNCS